MFSVHELLKNKVQKQQPSTRFEDDNYGQQMDEVALNGESEKNDRTTKKNGGLLSRRNIYIIVYIICLVGCAFQMVKVLILYFEFETVTSLAIEKSTRVIPPSLSICFPYISLVKLPLLFDKYPKLLPIAKNILTETNQTIDFDTYRIRSYKKFPGTFDWEFGKYIETHFTIREILSVTVTLEEMFDQCVVKSPQNYTTIDTKDFNTCLQFWDIDYYIKDETKCFLISYKPVEWKDFIFNLYRLSNSYEYRNLLLQLRLDWKKGLTERLERAFVIFHPKTRLPRGRVDPVLTLRYPARDVSYTITYSKTTNILLPHPYGSDCVNYEEKGFESRSDCIEKCVIRKSIILYKRVPYNLVFPRDSDLKIIGLKQANETWMIAIDEIFYDCRAECKNRNCNNEIYTPTLSAAEDGTKLKFIIEVPSAMDIHTELSEKLTLLEYIIYNTSTIGFWFGLCVLQFADFIEYIKKKRRDAARLKSVLKRKARRMTSANNS